MPWKKRVLVLANVTATSQELLEVMCSRAQGESVAYTLIVPATHSEGGRAAARAQLGGALAQLQDAGLDVDGEVRDADPLIAVTEAWDPKRYDEILISTLPMKFSKWMHAGLPERVSQAHRCACHACRRRAAAADRGAGTRPWARGSRPDARSAVGPAVGRPGMI